MKFKKSGVRARSALVGMAAVFALVLSACAGSGPSDDESSPAEAPQFSTIKDGTLILAFQDGGLPRIAADSDGKLTGSWGWLITKFAEKYDLEIELMGTDTAGEILAVSSDRADMGAAVYNRPDRQTVVRFLNYDTYDTYYVAHSKDLNYTGPESLDGKTVGVAQGFNAVQYLEEHFGANNVKQFTTYALGIEALENGQIDAYFNTLPLLGLIGADNPDFTMEMLEAGDFGFPADQVSTPEGPVVKCGNDDLEKAYNDFMLETIQTDEYKEQWEKEWSAVGAPDPMATMVTEALEVPNGC